MIWNYGFTKDETFGNKFEETYQTNCGMLTCITPGGVFMKGKKYPYYCRGGYANIIAFNIQNNKSVVYNLDAYEGDVYKIIGTLDELEDVEFKVVI